MAERPSIKEILEMARKGGPAQPGGEATAPAEPEAVAEAAAEPENVAPSAVTEPSAPVAAAPSSAPVPSPSTLGRPLTLKEKLAAARAGGAAQPGSTTATPAAPTASEVASVPDAPAEPAAAAAAAPVAPAPTPAELGRPLTLKEKLAAARSGAPAAPAAASGAKAGGKTAPAAPAATKTAAAARTLPPLDKITDPHDLAEAARQTAAKVKAATAARAATETATGKATPKHGVKGKGAEQVVPAKPRKGAALAGVPADRRSFLYSTWTWIILGWLSFTAGMTALTLACTRFLFPNVLAEPPSTIKVGVPSNFEPEDVSERWKAEWGFWMVRSSRYNGQDIIYAIQSVCTHLGCPPNWLAAEQKFKCPCHGSGFYVSGVNFEGPAPRPLERFKVSLSDDGQIVVDKSQKFQEEMGQWADPDSFIPV